MLVTLVSAGAGTGSVGFVVDVDRLPVDENYFDGLLKMIDFVALDVRSEIHNFFIHGYYNFIY